MSYILDALRRSDQLRRRGAVPTLPSMPASIEVPERQFLLRYGPLGLLPIVLISAALGWFGSWRTEADAAIPISGPTQPAPPAASPPVALALTPPGPPPARKPPERVHSATRVPQANGVPARRQPLVPAGALRSVEARPAQDQPNGGEIVVSASELPAAIRQSLPPMPVAVHAYSATPRDRLVSINGRLLHEGDELASGLRLEQITADGMVFSYRGHRFRRPAQ